MSTEVWGLMPKSQIDPETVEEAITRLIGVHEADPTSHMGENESIDAHRKSEVIDHLADSVVPDKINSYQKFVKPILLTTTILDFNECFIYNSPLGFSARHESPTTVEGNVSLFGLIPDDEYYDNGDIIVDFRIWGYGYAGNWQGRFQFGFAGIEVKYGYYRCMWYTTSWQYGSWIAQPVYNSLYFRVFYSVVDNTIHFQLNGIDIHTVVQAPLFEDWEMQFKMFINRNAVTSGTLVIDNLSYYLSQSF